MKIIRIDSPIGSGLRAALMSDSAVRPGRRPLFLPEGNWTCEIRPAVRIDRLGKAISAKFASRYYDCFALVNYLRPADGEPRDITADTMDDAIVLGDWAPISDASPEMKIDREAIDSLIERLSANTTFKTGDILILPQILEQYTPRLNQHISVGRPESPLIEFNVK